MLLETFTYDVHNSIHMYIYTCTCTCVCVQIKVILLNYYIHILYIVSVSRLFATITVTSVLSIVCHFIQQLMCWSPGLEMHQPG